MQAMMDVITGEVTHAEMRSGGEMQEEKGTLALTRSQLLETARWLLDNPARLPDGMLTLQWLEKRVEERLGGKVTPGQFYMITKFMAIITRCECVAASELEKGKQ